MFVLSRRKITAVAITCGLLAMLPAGTRAQAPGDDKALATALREGGIVILIRHSTRFADRADTDPFNLHDNFRQITATGRQPTDSLDGKQCEFLDDQDCADDGISERE